MTKRTPWDWEKYFNSIAPDGYRVVYKWWTFFIYKRYEDGQEHVLDLDALGLETYADLEKFLISNNEG